mmetsp:Transcript_69130/g.164727  ORF Transcript_69130/g.164727 Transcript_69130/m.164727 type:complete len:220 (+) Transcript_69130:52-711(+)
MSDSGTPRPPGPAPARVSPPGSAGSGGRPAAYLAPAAAIIRSSSQGSLKGEAADPLQRSNSSGSLRPSSAKRPSSGQLPSLDHAPPPPFATEKINRGIDHPPPPPFATEKAARGVPDQPPAPGTVKWVPHTHANPKHARFCFICLHGKLEGERDGIDEEVKRQKAEDQDLPSAMEMKEMGYLLPSPAGVSSEGGFRRAGADYERDNLSAIWLRQGSQKI